MGTANISSKNNKLTASDKRLQAISDRSDAALARMLALIEGISTPGYEESLLRSGVLTENKKKNDFNVMVLISVLEEMAKINDEIMKMQNEMEAAASESNRLLEKEYEVSQQKAQGDRELQDVEQEKAELEKALRAMDASIQSLLGEIKKLEEHLVTVLAARDKNTEQIQHSLTGIADKIRSGETDLGSSVNHKKLAKSLESISKNIGTGREAKTAGEIDQSITSAIKSSWIDKSRPVNVTDIKNIKEKIYKGPLGNDFSERVNLDAKAAKIETEIRHQTSAADRLIAERENITKKLAALNKVEVKQAEPARRPQP